MDLRFKIIAEHVQAGWDRAKQAIEDWKGRFRQMAQGGAAGWAIIVGGLITAAAGISRVLEGIRRKWIEEIGTMNAASRDFAEQTRDNLRKIRFQDTELEKARNVDSIKDQLSRRRQELEDLELDDSTESLAGKGMDWISGKWRKAKGMEDSDADAFRRKQLAQEIYTLERQLEMSKRKETKDAAESAKKAQEEIREAAKKTHQWEMEWLKEEQDARDAKNKAALESFEQMAKDAESIASRRAEVRALQGRVESAKEDFARRGKTPAELQEMDAAKLAKLGREYYARDGLGQFTASEEDRAGMIVEALGIKGDMADRVTAAKEAVDAEKKAQDAARKAAAGQTLNVGDLFTRMYGQTIKRGPEQETADNTKRAVELLAMIEKKTGAAP